MSPAEVETMFSNRETPWHGLGVVVEEALTSEEALKHAGLDWEVIPKPIFVDGAKVSGYIANVRSDNNRVLGIVSDRYQIVQNKTAFAFTDELVGRGVKYETAGSLFQGEKVWILANLPEQKILDDVIIPYLVFTNGHNGKNAVRVALTPVRVVCNNTLNIALNNTPRMWTTNHIGDIQVKLEEAKRTLELTVQYMDELNKEANILVKKTLTDKIIHEFTEELFPFPEKDMTEKKKSNIINLREELLYRYNNAPDLKKFKGTYWGILSAVTDFTTHTTPRRITETYKERLFDKVISGHPVIDRAYNLLQVA